MATEENELASADSNDRPGGRDMVTCQHQSRGSELTFLLELVRFVFARKKYWLLPVLVVFLLVSILLLLSQGSIIAPLIYTIF